MDQHISDAKLTLKKNGKSFYWAGKFLPSAYIDRASELYQFCRVLDDIADSGERRSLQTLKEIKSNFINHKELKFKNNCNLKYPSFFNIYSKKAATHLIDGLILDQNTVLFKEEEELIQYSYYVAGTVGLMMCDALKCKNKDAYLFAIDLGIAMQLTNIARDVLEDAKMGRRYIPGSWIDNISPNAMIQGVNDNDTEIFRTVSFGIKKLLNLAEKYYYSGTQGLIFLPLKTRIAISIASGVYRQIGIQLKLKNYCWYNGRQVTSNITKAKVTFFKIIEEFVRNKKQKNHDPELHKFLREIIVSE
ncbi:squalene/phytoene synthase family protein [Alphaproteobacteria bacterium]|nr:squalene/phytoene synthase family protein [Alphaproteobacteria bacterium]